MAERSVYISITPEGAAQLYERAVPVTELGLPCSEISGAELEVETRSRGVFSRLPVVSINFISQQ